MDKTKIAGLLIVLAVIVGFLVLTFDKKQNQESVPTTSMSTKEVLDGQAKKLEVKPELRDSIYTDWLENDNTVVPLTGQQFFMGTVNSNGIKAYNKIKDTDNITFQTMQPVENRSDSYFSSIGFTKNAMNTLRTGTTPIRTQFIGYEKDTMKCVIRLDEHTDPFGNFFCGKVDTAQIALQKEMGNMLPYSFSKNNMSSFRVQKIEGNFAIGSYSEPITGYTWIAKKDGTTWKVIWKATEIASCSDMERLGVPKSIYGDCYSPS